MRVMFNQVGGVYDNFYTYNEDPLDDGEHLSE